jgi:hypothetical protein
LYCFQYCKRDHQWQSLRAQFQTPSSQLHLQSQHSCES